jgi:hypothetical protein
MNVGIPCSATQSIVPPTYSSQLAQQFSISQTRAQSSINTYSGINNHHAQTQKNSSNIPHHNITSAIPTSNYATIETKGRKLKKFQQLQDAFYDSQLDPVDLPESRDPQNCAEYACDIFEFLLATENENIAVPGYMER